MGISPSLPSHAYTQLYLPADCFRLCHGGAPPHCFCRGPHHSRSKYVYVERNNTGGPPRESYRDPADLAAAGVMPPAWAAQPWRPKDYDVLSRVLGQLMAQQRGITEVPWAEVQGFAGYPGPGPGAGPGAGSGAGAPWMFGGADVEAARRQNERVKEMFDQVQTMSDCLFGSPAELREKRFEQRLLSHLQPLVPELAKLIALQQMGLVGGGGMGMGIGAGPAAGMSPFAGGMGGMQPAMNPFAMAGSGAVQGMHPMMAGGGGVDPRMMAEAGGMGGGMRRPSRGRRGIRNLEWDDEDDELEWGRGRGGGFGGGRRRRRGRYDDLDDLFGDRGGDGLRSPRGPPKRPHRPRPDNGGGSGAGGAVFGSFDDNVRFGAAPAAAPIPNATTAAPPPPPPPPPQYASPIPPQNNPLQRPIPVPPAATTPERIQTPVGTPLVGSPPPMPATRPSGVAPGVFPLASGVPSPGEGLPPYRSYPGTFDMPAPPIYPGAAVGGEPLARPGLRGRGVSFNPEAGLTRPREEEQNRGEPDAGGPAGRRDVL